MKTSELLINALDYIRQYKDNIFVIKLGGEVIPEKEVLGTIAKDLSFLKMVGINPLIVHGGGKEITNMMKKSGKEAKFVNGLRVTDEDTIRIVTKALRNINREIVTKLAEHGNKAIGLSGASHKIFISRAINPEMGLVGKITKVNPNIVRFHLNNGKIPVILPMGVGAGNQSLNINADTSASELAIAIGASKFIVVTNVEGVKDKNNNRISSLSIQEAKKLIKTKTISGGMLPKLNACINALEGSVEKAHIVKAGKHAILEEILTVKGTGTMITR